MLIPYEPSPALHPWHSAGRLVQHTQCSGCCGLLELPIFTRSLPMSLCSQVRSCGAMLTAWTPGLPLDSRLAACIAEQLAFGTDTASQLQHPRKFMKFVHIRRSHRRGQCDRQVQPRRIGRHRLWIRLHRWGIQPHICFRIDTFPE